MSSRAGLVILGCYCSNGLVSILPCIIKYSIFSYNLFPFLVSVSIFFLERTSTYTFVVIVRTEREVLHVQIISSGYSLGED